MRNRYEEMQGVICIFLAIFAMYDSSLRVDYFVVGSFTMNKNEKTLVLSNFKGSCYSVMASFILNKN